MFLDFCLFVLSLSYQFHYTDRTLCPMDKNHRLNMTRQQLIYIDVSTMSQDDMEFTFHARLLPDFQIQWASSLPVLCSVDCFLYKNFWIWQNIYNAWRSGENYDSFGGKGLKNWMYVQLFHLQLSSLKCNPYVVQEKLTHPKLHLTCFLLFSYAYYTCHNKHTHEVQQSFYVEMSFNWSWSVILSPFSPEHLETELSTKYDKTFCGKIECSSLVT